MRLFKEKLFFGCNRCGECCIHNHIPLNHFDIHRLIRAGHRPENFIRVVPATPEQADSLLIWESYQQLFLKQNRQTQACIFLVNQECSAYDARPTPCRIWPFERNQHHEIVISAAQKLLVDLACEKTRFKDHAALTKDLNQNQVEYKEYRHFVKRWNQQVKNKPEARGLEDLIQYIQQVLD